jgi:hypothetical protein
MPPNARALQVEGDKLVCWWQQVAESRCRPRVWWMFVVLALLLSLAFFPWSAVTWMKGPWESIK